MPQNEKLRLGTRGSKLALVQANMVAAALGGEVCEIVVLKTTGDRIQDRPLADAGGKGLFVKELEEALLDRRIDLAVHSMKDVPVELPSGLAIAALLPREDPRDVLVSRHTLESLPKGARLGTSSVRRAAQIGRLRPDLERVLLRGNVDTRLRKLDDGEMDAMLLALAGLKRLGLAHRATELLDILPALAQGAIGVETRGEDAHRAAHLNDAATAAALACERAFQAALGGSCRSPMAGLARVEMGRVIFDGEVLSPDGSEHVATHIEAAVADAAQAGRDAGLSIRDRAAPWLDL